MGIVASCIAFFAHAPATAQSVPPDVVELVGGGMVRGTIVQYVPGEPLIIQLATGELRTFPAEQIVRAGRAEPATSGPSVPEPPAPSVSERARVAPALSPSPPRTPGLYIRSDRPRLTLYYVAAMSQLQGWNRHVDHYERLCTPPCEAELAPGRYVFLYQDGLNPPQRFLTNPVDITPRTMLHVVNEDFSELRRIGAWIVGISIAVAAVFGISAFVNGMANSRDTEATAALGITAGSVFALGMAIGFAFVLQSDHIDIRSRTF